MGGVRAGVAGLSMLRRTVQRSEALRCGRTQSSLYEGRGKPLSGNSQMSVYKGSFQNHTQHCVSRSQVPPSASQISSAESSFGRLLSTQRSRFLRAVDAQLFALLLQLARQRLYQRCKERGFTFGIRFLLSSSSSHSIWHVPALIILSPSNIPYSRSQSRSSS